MNRAAAFISFPRFRPALGGLCALLGFTPAIAQEAPPRVPVTLVRVTAPTIFPVPLVGTLIESADSGLLLAGSQAGNRPIPLSAITKLEWSAGRHSQSGRFARKGAIALGGIAAVMGAVIYNDDGGERLAGAALVGLGGAAWGALGGALIGAFSHTYDWKEGPVPGRRVSVIPRITPGRGAGITLTFTSQ